MASQPRNPIPVPSRPVGTRLARRGQWPIVCVLAFAAALLLSTAATAYVVVLKDGTQIITAKEYELDGDRVILTMPNGLTTSYDASDVDFEETGKINEVGKGGRARFIEEKVLEVEGDDQDLIDVDASISQVVGRGLSLPEPKKRQPVAEGGPELPTTPAGYVDLARVQREPLADAEVTSEVQAYMEGQGTSLGLFQGVNEGLPLLLIRANTESEVFKGIRDSASALVQLTQRFPDRVQGFDILFLTEKEVRGGQFSMTPEQAQLIVSGRLGPQSYFLRYVEF
ncbi:MAG: hypothetical protein MPN21_08605 [Thermoanaerobaculia bacterium]|nr:hypothetical protein [Thermoanaerobaculia bacterium]